MRTVNTKIVAIDRLSTAIKYLTWAIQADNEKDQNEWTEEAKTMIHYASECIDK